MSARGRRVPSRLDTRGIERPSEAQLIAILRGADPLIGSGGRTMLVKLLRGSREQRVLELGLDKCPAYGALRDMSEQGVLARVDRVILDDSLRIEYAGRLPVLYYTDRGWAIERETMSDEFLAGFDTMLASGASDYNMSYLKIATARSSCSCWRRSKLPATRSTPRHAKTLGCLARRTGGQPAPERTHR